MNLRVLEHQTSAGSFSYIDTMASAHPTSSLSQTDRDASDQSEPGAVPKISLIIENYVEQRKKFWPSSGKHILAQYNDDGVVVYQAYKPEIADFAVANQRFGGDNFSYDRMSWIKSNFLWMMYRSGWATKPNQTRILAVTLSREGFDQILASAWTAQLQKDSNLSNNDIEVRLQWDPDHDPRGEKESRRAIQLGLKGSTLKKYGTEWVKKIEDITEFVRHQHFVLKTKDQWSISTPQERVYPVLNSTTAWRIDLDFYDHAGPTVVSSS